MAGYYADAEKYQISSWMLVCIEKEIDAHVQAEKDRIIKLLEEIISERQQVEQTTNVLNEISNLKYLIALIKGGK